MSVKGFRLNGTVYKYDSGELEPLVTPEEVTISDATVSMSLEAGKVYHFTSTALTSLSISSLISPSSGQLAQYHLDFICGASAPTISFPASVKFPSGNSFDANKRYEVDILNNYAVVASWATS